MSLERVKTLTATDVPELHRVVFTATGEHIAIGAEGD